jgi:hypothetical protein
MGQPGQRLLLPLKRHSELSVEPKMYLRNEHWYPADVCPRCKGVVSEQNIYTLAHKYGIF